MRLVTVVTSISFAAGVAACSSLIGVRDLASEAPPDAAGVPPRAPVDEDGSTELGVVGDVGDGSVDAGSGEPDAGGQADADAAASSPYGPDLARETGATATATTTYTGYAASSLVDGDVATSWYAASSSCASGAPAGYSCANLSATVTLAGSRTVARLVVYGNHDGFTGYDVVTERWELLDATQTVLSTANITLAGPSYDGATVLPTPVTGVAAVRFVVLTADNDGPGLGEIEIYAR